ncbi:hypothetical protein B0H13DRAFT_2654271 [Mycena leptocephala]|nr:hypothetical protein B0H13DRAFT_2654271 [Mycena leptocephala]
MSTPHDNLPQGVALGLSGLEGASYPFAGANSQLAFAVVSSVAFALVMWEYLTILPHEIRLYRKPVWGTIPPYAFLALRYGGILATLPMVFLSAVKIGDCQLAASLSQAGVILVVTSSAVIFTFRTSLLWADNRIVRGVLCGLLITMTACWVALATQYRAVTGPPPPFGSNCRVLPTVPWLPLSNAASTIFFITTLVLTLLKMQDHHPKASFATHHIYRANLLYLLGTTINVATALVVKSLSPPSSTLVLSTVPIATVFTVAFGTRAFRNFMLASVLEVDRAHGLPYPSSSQLVSHESDMRFAYPSPTRPLPIVAPRSTKSPRPPTTGPTRPLGGSSRPHTADSARTHTAGSTPSYTAGSTRPHTADSARPYTGGSTRPHAAGSTHPHTADSARPYTADSARPRTADSARPNTAGSSANGSTAHLNPYTTFPSPPSSYINHSLPTASPSPKVPLSISPPRRGTIREISESPKSVWSDT